SVDLYKGPGATAYGSGLGGLMLLRTCNQPDDNYLKTQITTGRFGFIKKNQVASISNDTYRLKLLQGYQHTDGYRANNSYDNRNYSVLAGVNNGNHQLSLLLHHININAQIPSSLNRKDFDNEPEKAAFTWGRVNGYEDYTKTVTGATYSTSAIDKTYLKATIFANIYQGFESRPFNILDDDSANFGLRSSFSYDFENRKKSKVQFGFEISKEEYNYDLYRTEDGVQGEQFQQNQELRSSTQFFAQYNMNFLDDLELQIGLNANLTSYTLDDQFASDMTDISGEYNYSWIYSPRLNLKYTLNESDHLYGLISHGYSIPTLEETLTPDGLINNDIKPEIGLNTEIGFRGMTHNEKWSYGLTAYQMLVKNLLVARRTAADQFIGVNAGGSRHMGAELVLDYKMFNSGDWRSDFNLAYTYQKFTFTDFVDGEEDYSSNELTGAIPNQVALGWSGGYKRLSLIIKYKFIDSMPMRDDNSIYSDAYSLLDMYISKTIAIRMFDIGMSVGVNNLLDIDYASMILVNAGSFGGNAPRYFYPGLPINAFGSMSIRYNF
ncbi:MAG: TonB-dependent receptor, partial [Saprospiraceae bacterium]|nr:TonB-dependent receptor [Saprospiraceae bacterium]